MRSIEQEFEEVLMLKKMWKEEKVVEWCQRRAKRRDWEQEELRRELTIEYKLSRLEWHWEPERVEVVVLVHSLL